MAANLFKWTKEDGVAPTANTYNSAVETCRDGGEWRPAGDLLDEMRNGDAAPDVETYNFAITP